MCDFCEMYTCPPACPSYETDHAERAGRCAFCERELRRGEEALVQGESCLCLDCVEELDIDTLLYLCGMERVEELLYDGLGWKREVL